MRTITYEDLLNCGKKANLANMSCHAANYLSKSDKDFSRANRVISHDLKSSNN